MRLRLLGGLIGGLLAGLSALAGAWHWPGSCAAGSWVAPRVMPMGRPGKTGIAAAKRRARKARNCRRQRHGRA